MSLPGFLEQVLVVIVLYRQALKNSKAIAAIEGLRQKQQCKVSMFVYDNSPESENPQLADCTYVHDPSNPGVSRAYNSAFKYAKKQGFKLLLLLDQDSFIPFETFLAYKDAFTNNNGGHVFAPTAKSGTTVYSPFIFFYGRGKQVRFMRPGNYPLSKYKIINSGLLITAEAFEKAGGYDENYGLDLSDIVFCDRLAKANYSFTLINGVLMHEHSSKDKHNENTKMRFEKFLNALDLYRVQHAFRLAYWHGGFSRAIKLTTKHRSLWYVQQFFKIKA
jgi:rhamnosyltransferase